MKMIVDQNSKTKKQQGRKHKNLNKMWHFDSENCVSHIRVWCQKLMLLICSKIVRTDFSFPRIFLGQNPVEFDIG